MLVKTSPCRCSVRPLEVFFWEGGFLQNNSKMVLSNSCAIAECSFGRCRNYSSSHSQPREVGITPLESMKRMG